jgi:N-methylhydantoinase B
VEPVEASARRIGERLRVLESADGAYWFGCDCGHVLAPAEENWKRYAGRATLTAEDLGAKVRLHPDFTAEAYACPGCGGRLAVEVRWTVDAPLHDVELSLRQAHDRAG